MFKSPVQTVLCCAITILLPQASQSNLSPIPGTIAEAKLNGGYSVTLSGKIVSGVCPFLDYSGINYFYVQEPDRTCGIRVIPTSPSLVPAGLKLGDEVTIICDVVAELMRAEMCLLAYGVTVTGWCEPPAPLGISGISTAGDSFGLQQALYRSTASQPFVRGSGLNMVGSLVRVWGRFCKDPAGGNEHYIDDGSGLAWASGRKGLRLYYTYANQIPIWEDGKMIAITGNLGAEFAQIWTPAPALRVDSTPPGAFVVIDDGMKSPSLSWLHATCTIPPDPESGISEYEYAVGTAAYPNAGWNSLRGWTSAGTSTDFYAGGLNLATGGTYYITIRAINGSGLAVIASSDGITIDDALEEIIIRYQDSQVPQYEKFEASFLINADLIGGAFIDYNPFNPGLTPIGDGGKFWRKKGICVDAIITRPDGTSHRWPCFYDYGRGWKLRYAPDTLGVWSYRIEARYGTAVIYSPTSSFVCTANESGKSRRGFLTKDSTDWRFFSFTNGEVFYPIGAAARFVSDIQSLGANGGNWVRVFRASAMFEQYAAYPDHVNNFQESKALFWDEYFDACRDNGVYVLWLCNDWTRWKSSKENPYLVEGVAADVADSFTGAQTREVFKRKLRWMMARWGYSTNLVGFDLINECGHGSGAADFHEDMARLVAGADDSIPPEWGAVPGASPVSNDLENLPHLATGDLTSSEYREQDVPWRSENILMTTFHDYGRIRADGTALYWSTVRWTDPEGSTQSGWETMGSALDCPWIDAAVWADRTARMHRRAGYTKPFSWTEYGLIRIDSGGSWRDWNDAYYGSTSDPSITGDREGRHAKDWFWALIMNGVSGVHWDTGWLSAEPSKWWIMKPLSNFLVGVDMRGLTQETYYTVDDPLNPTKRVISSNDQAGVFAMRGTDKAYLYVKNLTSTWYYAAGFRDWSVPTPAAQDATITIKDLSPGTYRIERWSTTDTDPATQVQSVETKTIAAEEDLMFNVTLGDLNDYDCGYKVVVSDEL